MKTIVRTAFISISLIMIANTASALECETQVSNKLSGIETTTLIAGKGNSGSKGQKQRPTDLPQNSSGTSALSNIADNSVQPLDTTTLIAGRGDSGSKGRKQQPTALSQNAKA